MPAPVVMAAWTDVWKHQLTLYLRARETFEGDSPAAYYRMLRLTTSQCAAPAVNQEVTEDVG